MGEQGWRPALSNDLPVVGAAMTVSDLAANRDWLIARQRDLELQDFIEPALLEGDWRDRVAAARALLGGYSGRLGIHGPFWNLPLGAQDPLIRDAVRRRLWQGLDVCEALGATHMVVHSPFTTWDHNNLDKDPGARDRLIEMCHWSMGDAVRRAESIGVILVIENIEDKDPSARVALARAFNSPAVAVSVDTGHAHYAHGSTGAPPVDYYLLAAGDLLAHVHLQDADGYADRHWVPGEGTIRWASVFSAIRQLATTPRLILELRDCARIQQAAGWLAAQGLVE
jgi:sugar phosphate isomerase/epimerase